MNRWVELHEQHKALRATGGRTLNGLRVLFASLVNLGHLDASISSRFTNAADRRMRSWRIAPRSGKPEKWAEPLQRLAPGITAAELTVLASTDPDVVELREFTAMVSGRRHDASPFKIAAHLDDEHLGDGACGHALFHCHVGPSLDELPKVRVPLPALTAVEVVEWILTPVLAGWEPQPWSQLPAAVKMRADPARSKR